jgi:hypothetical protein
MRYKFKIYCSKNNIYHIYDKNKYIIKHKVNISNYIPSVIKQIVRNIPPHLNHYYIVCPFYNNLFDYQIGITETSKEHETTYETIIRGINEEAGLDNVIWDENHIHIVHDTNKEWYGINILNNDYIYNPGKQYNTSSNNDTEEFKIAVIICNKLDNLLTKYSNFNKGDIKTDNINSLGLISVYDCKNIINS